MIKNSPLAYGCIAKGFHWLVALLMIGMFIVAYIMINLSASDFKYSLYNLHKATGMLIFALVALRLVWRWFNVAPLLSDAPRWQQLTAKWNVIALYLLMFLMPVTGFLTSILGNHIVSFYGLFSIAPVANNKVISTFFSEAHEILSYCMLITFSLHVLGALYHHYFLKDGVLKRMWIET